MKKRVNREIVSFRSCVRASEAACAREAMCSLSLGRRTSKRAPVPSRPVRALPLGPYAPHINKFFEVFGEAWGSVRCASLSELVLGESLRGLGKPFCFWHIDVPIVRLIAGASGPKRCNAGPSGPKGCAAASLFVVHEAPALLMRRQRCS